MIHIDNIDKFYNGKQALKKLSLDIKSGDIYALLGSNGAGKTTTINLLMGFLKPDAGKLSIDGISPNDDLPSVRKSIAYIPENVSLYPYLSGIENLEFFSKLGGETHTREHLESLLLTSGLQKEAFKKPTSGYSKGMRQKVGIAIALAKNAKALLLDEPASGLDPKASNELSTILKKLAESGKAILMASHDLFRVRETANRIGILHDGELLKELDAESVTANDLEKLYLAYMKN